MRYIFDLVHHFLTANSRHGTHSPFVYSLAEQVLYNKTNISNRNKQELPNSLNLPYNWLISRILKHWGMRSVLVVDSLNAFKIGYQKSKARKSAFYLPIEHATDQALSVCLAASPFSAVFIGRIYSSAITKRQWQHLKEHPSVSLSIDLFHFGILIQKDTKQVEHFKLRFPYYFK